MLTKPIILVVGGSRSGKSTIIRSLTGCHSGTFAGYVIDRKTGHRLYVVAASPQESSVPSWKDIRRQLLVSARSRVVVGAVMAIQPTRPYSRPSLEEVVAYAVRCGFRVVTFVLRPPYRPTSSAARRSWSGSDVGERLHTFRVRPPVTLDGRRFALVNAKKIAASARLFLPE
jgi:hypothetical protein